MRRSDRNAVAAISNGEPVGARPKSNGHSGPDTAPVDLVAILASLQTMRNGDFSVRLPGSWIGSAGKIADTFNEIVATNQQMAEELKRVGQVVGKEGKTRERTRFYESRGAWGEMEGCAWGTPHRGFLRLGSIPSWNSVATPSLVDLISAN